MQHSTVLDKLESRGISTVGRRRKRYAVGFDPESVGLPEPRSSLVENGECVITTPVTNRRPSVNFRALPWGEVPGYAPLSPDRNSPTAAARGAKKRYLRDLPVAQDSLLTELGVFVDRLLVEEFRPIGVHDLPSYDEWERSAPYSESRKRELRDSAEKYHFGRPPRHVCEHIDSFIKNESYPEFKEARWINSRHDAFKAYSARFFKAIEEAVYKNKAFIKHVPIPERAAFINAMYEAGLHCYENDYKAYESHFIQKLMRMVECKLYAYMLKNFPEDAKFINDIISGTNRLSTRLGVLVTVLARRMSGDMCTSLGNGFTNYVLFKFIMHKKHENGKCVVEGDDGLFACTCQLTSQDFADLGFTVEIHEIPHPSKGHFCGMTFCSDGTCIKDPRRVFQTFGWTGSYIHAGLPIMEHLLRSKAQCLAYEMPQCPIIGQLSRTALLLTSHIKQVDYREDRWAADWKLIAAYEPPPFAPSAEARELFSEIYGVGIETQLAVEELIRKGDLSKIPDYLPAPRDVQIYSERYIEVR